MGQDLNVTLNGSGFDENTRVSMYLDPGNQRMILEKVELHGYALGVQVSGNYAYVLDFIYGENANYGGLLVIDISDLLNPQIIGAVATPGAGYRVFISGNYAYVADGGSGLQVIDISDPSNPNIIGTADTPISALGVYVSGNYAYVADSDSGLQVIDISDPSSPQIIASVDTPGKARNVRVSGNYAYVADYNEGLQVIDISDPSNPQIVGNVDPGSAWDIYILDNYAYVADWFGGLQVIDISDPSNPNIIGNVYTGATSGVYASGSYAYVADYNEGLQVIDISDPSNPQIIGNVETPDNAFRVYVSENYAYVAANNSGLQVIDISDSSNPQIIGKAYTTACEAKKVYISGSYAYVVVRETGLQVIDISDSSNPQVIGTVDTYGITQDVYISGYYAYVADGSRGLQVIDISNPSNPRIIGNVDTPGDAHRVFVSGYYVYLVDKGSGLQVIDISNPSSPQIVGNVDTPGDTREVYVLGNYAYVADYNEGLQVIDISDPSNPQIVGNLASINAICVFVSGNYAYVSDGGGGFILVDISDPYSPQFAGFIILSMFEYAVSIHVSSSYAYVSDSHSIQTIDISDPSNLKVIGSLYSPEEISDVHVSGSYAYVASHSAGLRVIDISNPIPLSQHIGFASIPALFLHAPLYVSGNYAYVPDFWGVFHVIDISETSNPQFVGAVNTTADNAEDIYVSGEYAYVLDWFEGLQVLDISNPQTPVVIGAVDIPGYVSSIHVSGSYAYVATYDDLQVIDINNPSNPQIIGNVDTSVSISDVYVSGNYAYVTAYSNGFQIIDITDLSNPQIIGNVDTPGDAREVYVIGNYAYVADGGSGLQVIDISDPSSPQIIGNVNLGRVYNIHVSGSYVYIEQFNRLLVIEINNPSNPQVIGEIDTLGWTLDSFVTGNCVYSLKNFGGLVTIPLSVEIVTINNKSPTSISATLPSPIIPGRYTLRVFNETENSEFLGAVSFTDDYTALNSKAIIVAGGGPNTTGGNLWTETKVIANKAYDALILQGYQHDSIYYISEETFKEYVDNSTPETFMDDLSDKINFWASDASQLLIHFVDHGEKREFILYSDDTTTISLSAQELDGWLDNLQETMTGSVTFIYDACLSGSFISKMYPPEGKERVVITGASNEEPAYFLENGESSFSYQFWDKIIFNSGNVGDAFSYAKDTMKGYQNAQVESNWDLEGNSNESEDINIAKDMTIKRGGYAYIGVHPYVSNVSDFQVLTSGTSATIWASGVIDSDGVQAMIIPPDINPEASNIPITYLDTIELTDPDGDHTYEGVYNEFDKEGTYTVVIKAFVTRELYSYVDKTMTTHNIYSPPMYTAVTNLSEVQGDSYEVDDTYNHASIIVLNDTLPQSHNFHDVGDEDWVKFYGISGETYKIRASNVSVFCDPIIEVFDSDGITLLSDPINRGGLWEDEYLDWLCPENGIYYVKITNANSNFGENVEYDLKIYRPLAGLPGTLTGMVINSLSQGIGNALITSDISPATTIAHDDGTYEIVLPSGTHVLTVDAPGYISGNEGGIIIEADGETVIFFTLFASGGDKDLDGMPDEWEEQYDLDPEFPDANLDPDGDGFNNILEYLRGTNPLDAESHPPRALPWLMLLLEDG